MRRMLAVKRTVLAQLDTLRFFLLVVSAGVIDTLALCTLEMDDFSHGVDRSRTKSPRPGLNW